MYSGAWIQLSVTFIYCVSINCRLIQYELQELLFANISQTRHDKLILFKYLASPKSPTSRDINDMPLDSMQKCLMKRTNRAITMKSKIVWRELE
jgi:hypothetical protein